MQGNALQPALMALALLLASAPLHAADSALGKADAAARTPHAAKTKPAKAAANVHLVDINSAGKDELKKLPGIRDAEADRIIAGRPYGSKAWLLTNKVLAADAYQVIKARIVARHPEQIFTKPAKGKPAQGGGK